ncbi:MAG: carboxypeptidase-like regulatory domain-containing protein [Planctomycetota bacterium]
MAGRPTRALALVAIVVLAALAALPAVLRLLDDGDRSLLTPHASPKTASVASTAAEPEAAAARPDAAARERVAVPADASGSPDAVPRADQPTRGTLAVHLVWRGTNDPVADVDVDVRDETERDGWSDPEHRLTDENGCARFDLPGGRYRVATAPGGDAGTFAVVPGLTRAAEIELPRGYTLVGTVVDEGHRAVAGASIWLAERWSDRRGRVAARTDAEGAFRIDGVIDHRLVSATADAYAPSHQLPVHAAEGETRTVAFELRGGGALAGRVVDPTGGAVAGAQVLLGSERVIYDARDETGRGIASPLPRRLRADADGRFAAAGLCPGPTAVQVRAPGFAPANFELQAAPGGTAVQIVTLQHEAIVAGCVRDRRNEPVADAVIRCGADDAFAAVSTVSDAHGDFELRGLPPDLVEVVATKNEMGRANAELALRAGGRTTWNPILGDPEAAGGVLLRGVVVDALGAPQPRLQLSVRDAAETSTAGPQARTGNDGAFTVRVPWQAVRIVVQRAGGWRDFPLLVADDVRPADGPVRLQVPDPATASGRIAGVIVDPDGAPLAARLTVWHQEARLWREFESDAEGTLHVDGVLPGALDMEVRADGHPWVVLGTREVPAGGVLQLGTIRLPRSARIRGTFTAPPGIDVAQLEFSIYRDHGPEGAVIRAGDDRFESGPLAPAEYEVRIQGRGVATWNRRVAVQAGADADVHADLQPGVVRSVEVVLPAGGARRPRWVRIQVRTQNGDLAWSGGLGPGAGSGADISVRAGSYVVQVFAEGDLQGEAPLRVDGAEAAPAPIRIELRKQ